MKINEYESLNDNFNKTKYLTIALYISVIIATIALMVLPIFTREYSETVSMNDFRNEKEYYEFLETLTPEELLTGKVVKQQGISVVLELKFAFDNYSFGMPSIIVIAFLAIIILTALYICFKMWLNLSAVLSTNSNNDKYIREKYKEMLNKKEEKKTKFHNKTNIGCFYEILADIGLYLLLILFGNNLSMSIYNEPAFKNTAFTQMDAISPYILLSIAFICAIVVLDFYLRKENSALEKLVIEHNAKRQLEVAEKKQKNKQDSNTEIAIKKIDNTPVKTGSRSNSGNTDLETEMTKYKALLDKGIITQEEFDAKKKQLLGL